MATVSYQKGQAIYQAGNKMKTISLIVRGGVCQKKKDATISLEPGHLVGITDVAFGEYQFDYFAKIDTVVYEFEYREQKDMNQIFGTAPDYASVFLLATIKQARTLANYFQDCVEKSKKLYMIVVKMYEEYLRYCGKYQHPVIPFGKMDLVQQLDYSNMASPWQIDYYGAMARFSLEEIKNIFQDDALNIGVIFQASKDLTQMFQAIDQMESYCRTMTQYIFNSKSNDLLYRICELTFRSFVSEDDSAEIYDVISQMKEVFLRYHIYTEEELNLRLDQEQERYQQLDHIEIDSDGIDCALEHSKTALDCILTFAGLKENMMESFSLKLDKIKNLSDWTSTEDDVRALRKSVANDYYIIYKAVIKRALEEKDLSSQIKMFLSFGFIDETLAGGEATSMLMEMIDHVEDQAKSNVYTLFQWLQAIYKGEKEPSISELDETYDKSLREAFRQGELSDKELLEKRQDKWGRVEFELDHMFQNTNKITNGRIMTFLPILCEQDLIWSIDKMLVTTQKIKNAMDNLKRVDYSLFYRDVLVEEDLREHIKELVHVEVFPDIILLPNAGSRGVMWQPTGDARDRSPARFMFPILTIEDIDDLLTGVCARFRWELCKKFQGSRWNDITEPSLTSEYSDYLQYYRKNYDLSQEAKDRIHTQLVKGKNNYKEVFASDYMIWIKFESKGSFRLNRYVRQIIFRYCPFSQDIRKSFHENPMYRDIFERYELQKTKKIRKAELVYDKFQKTGRELTDELEKSIEFLHM